MNAVEAADQLRDLVLARIGVPATELQCPREKSPMTPCVARDGGSAVAELHGVPQICVGCERNVADLLEDELQKQPAQKKNPAMSKTDMSPGGRVWFGCVVRSGCAGQQRPSERFHAGDVRV